jgi:hypothetical protein
MLHACCMCFAIALSELELECQNHGALQPFFFTVIDPYLSLQPCITITTFKSGDPVPLIKLN